MGLTKPRAYQIYDIDYKQATRVATITNTTLSGGAPNVVDGVTLTLNDRVLVAGQSTGSENGLYYVTTVGSGSNGTWSRSVDGDQQGEINAGLIVMVTEGNVYADTQWKLTTNDPIVIGVTPLTFVFNALNVYFTSISAGGNVLTASGNASVVNFAAGSGMSITGNTVSNTITFTSTASGTNANISNGTSNVNVVSSGGNVTVGVSGVGNVVVWAPTGEYVTGLLSVTGNITGGNISATSHTGSVVSVTGAVTGASVVGGVITGTSTSVTGTQTAASTVGGVITGTSTSVTGTATSASTVGGVITGSSLSVSGTQTAASTVGGVITGTSLSVSGSVTGGAHNGTSVSVSGAVTAASVVGGVITGSSTSVTGAQTAASTVGGVITGSSASVTGIVTGASVVGGVMTGSSVSVTGNVTAVNHFGTNTSVTGTQTAASTVGGVITGSSVSVTGAVSGASASVSGGVTAASVAGGVMTGTSLSTTANVTGGNVVTATIAPVGNLVVNAANVVLAATFSNTGAYLTVPAANATVASFAVNSTTTQMTTIGAGAFEYSGNTLYFGSTAGNRGAVSTGHYYRLGSNLTLSSATTAQNWLGVSVGLAGNTTYAFTGLFNLTTTSTNSHTEAIGFGGTAGITNIGYLSVRGNANAITATTGNTYMVYHNANASTVQTGAFTTAQNVYYQLSGTVATGAPGTFSPQITFSANAQVATIVTGSYFEIFPLGAGTANLAIGNWA